MSLFEGNEKWRETDTFPTESTNQQGQYIVVAPQVLRLSAPYQVVITVHNVSEPVIVNVTVNCTIPMSNEVQEVSGEIAINNGEMKILNLNIPEWESGESTVTIMGRGGITFKETLHLRDDIIINRIGMFIQSDKSIYKPGQLVQFRVLVVDRCLKPYKSNDLNVYIKDADGNRIKEWTHASLEYGIFSGELQLTDRPVLGDWTIHTNLKDLIVTKNVAVEEYVLPKFEVKIKTKSLITFEDSDLPISIDARYTYGKGVKGKVLVTASYDRSSRRDSPGKTDVETEIFGTAIVSIPISSFKFTDYELRNQVEVNIQAVVTEELTGRTVSDSSTVTIYSVREKIAIEQSRKRFKPGLRHTYTITVQMQDGTPLSDTYTPLTVNILIDDKSSINKYTIPPNGVVIVDVLPSEYANSIEIKADYKKANKSLVTYKIRKTASSYLQLSINKTNLKVGDTVDICVKATLSLPDIYYMMVSNAKIVTSGRVQFENTAECQSFSLILTPEMAADGWIIVYRVSVAGEVISDCQKITVESVFQESIEVITSEDHTEPGSPFEVTVETNPNALVGFLGVDQSVSLMKSGNDLNMKDIMAFKHDNPFHGRDVSNFYQEDGSLTAVFESTGFLTVSNILDDLIKKKNVSTKILRSLDSVSNATLQQQTDSLDRSQGVRRPKCFEMPECEVVEIKLHTVRKLKVGGDFPAMQNFDVTPKVRRIFPETWIWDLLPSGEDGKAMLKTKVPDTITSWVISAFSMDSETGLRLTDNRKKVEVFRPFFISLNLPYSIIRGETVNLQAIVFNYLKKDIQAEITLDNTAGQFELTGLRNEIEGKVDEGIERKTIEVKADDGTAVSFSITPLVIGYIDLKLTAISLPNAGDALEQKLLVKAEGSPQYFNKALILDLRSTSTFNYSIEISIPENAVKDSEYVEVSVTGDILGSTISNLDYLLRMPYGCGEQNMVNFVPNIVVCNYLSNMNQLTPKLKEKAVTNMEAGYQRELSYKRPDGSFSAFGKHDHAGSTWLTAFVVRAFGQARPYILIDMSVIDRALKFLASRQEKDDSFQELGVIFDKRLQGGSSSGLSLTAYVLLAFLENNVDSKYDNVIQAALKLLEQEVDSIDDVYQLSIVTYALHLAMSSKKTAALQKLLKKSEKKGSQMYWTKPVVKPGITKSSVFRPPSSVDVEMNSYNLMTLIADGQVIESFAVMKWLLTQQNENGGFSSTQDTVVGIQALAEMGSRVGAGDFKMNIQISYNGHSKLFDVNRSNAIILQKADLPRETRKVEIIGTGNGVGIVDISWSYNLHNKTSSEVFKITPEVKEINNTTFQLTACAVYDDEEDDSSNMAVIEMNLPTGYLVDSDSLPSHKDCGTLKQVDVANGGTKVEIFFDKIDKTPVCPTITAYRTFEVANLKPASICVYDYYDNGKKAEAFYDAPVG